MNALYERLIERDLDAIPAAVRAFRQEHSSHDLFLAVARFAILAYAPSQHAKHAVLSCLAAYELREEAGERFDDLMTECAIYTAMGRQPWSEPPILTPPVIADDQRGDLEEIRAAIDAGDRLRAERWLAKRYEDADFERDFFTVAADDFEDLGHKLIVANAAWKLAPILGEQGRYATLRIAVWEWTAYRGERFLSSGPPVDVAPVWEGLVEEFIDSRGELIAAHRLFLLDAAMECGQQQRVAESELRARRGAPVRAASGPPAAPSALPIYRLARDYGEYLKMHALAKRRREPRVIAPAYDHLQREDFTLA